jgi:hypothetical protein
MNTTNTVSSATIKQLMQTPRLAIDMPLTPRTISTEKLGNSSADSFHSHQAQRATVKKPSSLSQERNWLLTGAFLAGATSLVGTSIWLAVAIGIKRFLKPNALHSNLVMGLVGGLLVGGALGGLSFRFTNSIKERLKT